MIQDEEALLRATSNQAEENLSVVLLDKSKDAAKVADHYVRGNLWGALGIACGTGLVFALLTQGN